MSNIKKELKEKPVKCQLCERLYLVDDEVELINERGYCYSCWVKLKASEELADSKPYAEDGKFCSRCGTELDVEYDDEGFYYLFCPKCREKVLTSRPEYYVNDIGETLPF